MKRDEILRDIYLKLEPTATWQKIRNLFIRRVHNFKILEAKHYAQIDSDEARNAKCRMVFEIIYRFGELDEDPSNRTLGPSVVVNESQVIRPQEVAEVFKIMTDPILPRSYRIAKNSITAEQFVHFIYDNVGCIASPEVLDKARFTCNKIPSEFIESEEFNREQRQALEDDAIRRLVEIMSFYGDLPRSILDEAYGQHAISMVMKE